MLLGVGGWLCPCVAASGPTTLTRTPCCEPGVSDGPVTRLTCLWQRCKGNPAISCMLVAESELKATLEGHRNRFVMLCSESCGVASGCIKVELGKVSSVGVCNRVGPLGPAGSSIDEDSL
eukprot:CAMPEP_0170650716 /NCGR_PEP_ID=MMETSP0224-20130122/45964_1 /TAXON_ID=285029 /ORGANISM="Togula jolla, Strain CCCM 725" /LENGTH=119 /DNA_ID=CAMNT_0010982423 /DNA_START=491 /DNA_END=850 /DNA_ORIENTATION=-